MSTLKRTRLRSVVFVDREGRVVEDKFGNTGAILVRYQGGRIPPCVACLVTKSRLF